jgi:hypothetical protein
MTILLPVLAGVVAWLGYLAHEAYHRGVLRDAARAYGHAYVEWRDHGGVPPVIPDILGGPRPAARYVHLEPARLRKPRRVPLFSELSALPESHVHSKVA